MGVNLITPRNTLNEQLTIIPANTYSTLAALADGINEKLSELFGWELSDGKCLVSRDGQMYVQAFNTSNAASLRIGNAAGAQKSVNAAFSTNSPVYIYHHASADGTIFYFGLGSSEKVTGYNITVLLAENTAGKVTAFYGGTNGEAVCQDLATVVTVLGFSTGAAAQATGENFYYSVTKFPDIFGGAEYAELYRTISVKSLVLHNQTVRFGDNYFRLAHGMYGGNAFLWFAFPVAD